MGFLLILHSACSLAETGIEFRKASGIKIFVAKSFYFLADFYFCEGRFCTGRQSYGYMDMVIKKLFTFVDGTSCSIGHPPHSSASPVELRLRVGPRALSGKKKK
jgi:hypothetical protein